MRDEGESRWCGGWCGCCCSGAKVAEEPAPFSLSLGGTATGDTPEPCTLLLATRCSFLSMRSVYSRCELASAQMVSSNLLAISRIFSASARRVSELVNRSITSCEHAARRGKERGSDGGKNERARVFLQRGGKRDRTRVVGVQGLCGCGGSPVACARETRPARRAATRRCWAAASPSWAEKTRARCPKGNKVWTTGALPDVLHVRASRLWRLSRPRCWAPRRPPAPRAPTIAWPPGHREASQTHR